MPRLNLQSHSCAVIRFIVGSSRDRRKDDESIIVGQFTHTNLTSVYPLSESKVKEKDFADKNADEERPLGLPKQDFQNSRCARL